MSNNHDQLPYLLPHIYETSTSRLSWSTFFLYILAALGFLTLVAQFLGGRNTGPKKIKRKRKQNTTARTSITTEGTIMEDENRKQLANLPDEESEYECEDDEEPRDYSKVVGDTITKAMVNSAVLLKRSPIPDFLVSMTGYSLEGYKRVNNAFGVEDKMVKAGQKAVSAGITATGIFAQAAIKAGIAYQMAPGHRENLHKLAIKDAQAAEKESVRIVRIVENAVPGSIPPPPLVDASTQTDDDSGSSVPGTSTKSEGVSSVLASYLASSLRVAGNVATAGSEVVLGKDRTMKLLGVDPIEARRNPEAPEDGNVRYINVGGVLYATTFETLTAAEGSLLAEWFADEEKRSTLEVKDGSYFVDRDGTHFRHILNYLRGLPTHHTMTDVPSLKQLLVEAEFYRLPELVEEVGRRIKEAEREEQSVMELLDKFLYKVTPAGVSRRTAILAGNAALVAGVVGLLFVY